MGAFQGWRVEIRNCSIQIKASVTSSQLAGLAYAENCRFAAQNSIEGVVLERSFSSYSGSTHGSDPRNIRTIQSTQDVCLR
jgi:hypothetical protein